MNALEIHFIRTYTDFVIFFRKTGKKKNNYL